MVDPAAERKISEITYRIVDYLWTLSLEELEEFQQALEFLMFTFKAGRV